jgi:hypothetical protein
MLSGNVFAKIASPSHGGMADEQQRKRYDQGKVHLPQIRMDVYSGALTTDAKEYLQVGMIRPGGGGLTTRSNSTPNLHAPAS